MPFKPVPRLRGFQYQGVHRYSLTFCVHERAHVFVSHPGVDCVLLQIRHASARSGFAVIAYCFMPDHLHLLVEGVRTTANLREFARTFKQRSSFHWRRDHGGTLWQRGYYDHVLRRDEDVVTVARYVLANPVRAGLVRDVLDYPFLGSFVLNIGDLLASTSGG